MLVHMVRKEDFAKFDPIQVFAQHPISAKKLVSRWHSGEFYFAYEVYHKDKVKYSGQSFQEAIDIYNGL